MKTVLGLYWRDEDAQDAVRRLEEAGFERSSINAPQRVNRRRLAGDLGRPVARYAASGSIIGVAIFAVFGLGAAIAGCTYCGYDLTYAIGTLLGFVVVGALAGAFLGQWIGVDAMEKDTHLYAQGVQQGGRLVAVEAEKRYCTKAMEIMRDGNAVAVTVLRA